MKYFPLIVALALFNSPAFATNRSCPMIEKSNINVSFNWQQLDLADIKARVNDKLKLVEQQAEELGIETFEMNSMNYNLYANNNGNCCQNNEKTYRLNGNMNFNIYPSEKAVELLVKLDSQGFSSRLNVNKHQRCH